MFALLTASMQKRNFFFPTPRLTVLTLFREPVPVLEKTLRAVLNLDYPGEQMSVNILPDGFYGKNNKSVEIFQMVRKVLQEEATKLRQAPFFD